MISFWMQSWHYTKIDERELYEEWQDLLENKLAPTNDKPFLNTIMYEVEFNDG